MKHGGFKAACLVLMACTVLVSVHAQEKTLDLQSRIVESFDGDSGYTWQVSASKFATKTDSEEYPKVAYIDAWPTALFGRNRDDKDLKVLGVYGKFDRPGYNWIDIYPMKEDAAQEDLPAEIPLSGRPSMLDMWVWGANFHFYLELYVRDYKGVVHMIPFGSTYHVGWKNIRVNIPTNIPQEARTVPHRQGLRLVKFRLWTRPHERVSDFQIYFDQIKILTDTFEYMFDGDELSDPERIQEIWSADN